MAHVYTDDLLIKTDRSLSYPELARLKAAADLGDAAAAIRLAQMPDGEQRLAGMLVKAFGGQPGKVKKARKPKVTKSGGVKVTKARRDALLAADRALRLAAEESRNPYRREWARMAGRG